MRKSAAFLIAATSVALIVSAQPDPLAAEIERWSAFLRSDAGTGETWKDVKQGSAPVLARAEAALRAGRRLLALQRFAAVRVNLEAAAYGLSGPEDQRKDLARFEAQWKRAAGTLRDVRRLPSPRTFDDLEPAAIRAQAEAAVPQVRIFYEASLEYGRNTTPESGLFYLGAAKAQQDFVDFVRKLAKPTALQPPPLRPLQNELDAIERELLAAYRPPASIDRHPEFIGASSMVKEARELDAAGFRYGAMLRYLEAWRRLGQIRGSEINRDDTASRLRDFQSRIAAAAVDHSIVQFFVEAAEDDLANTAAGSTPNVAISVATFVLPRYFAALEPVTAPAPKATPRVTVTLVRWPYT